jgi:hypothetical protein
MLVLTCGASSVASARALPVCVWRLAAEAGWDGAPSVAWHPVDVRTDDRGRPVGVGLGAPTTSFEILGTIAGGLARFERGWRVRLGDGEATIVREPSGHWYTDEAHLTGPPAG